MKKQYKIRQMMWLCLNIAWKKLKTDIKSLHFCTRSTTDLTHQKYLKKGSSSSKKIKFSKNVTDIPRLTSSEAKRCIPTNKGKKMCPFNEVGLQSYVFISRIQSFISIKLFRSFSLSTMPLSTKVYALAVVLSGHWR